MKKLLLPTLVFIFISGCAIQPKIDTDTDRTYSLSSYKSFSLESLEMEDEPSQISVNPILLQRVSRSIEQKLITRGFTKSSNPDMIVRFSVATEREVDRSYSSGTWYRRGYFDDRDEKYYRVDKDSLSIRFHDAKTNEVIWYAFSRFSRAQAPKTQEEVDNLVRQAISKFNPGQ